MLVILLGQLCLVTLALTTPEPDPVYVKLHGSLLIVSIFAILVFFAVKKPVAEMLRTTWSTALRPGHANPDEISDGLVVLSLVIALASVAFIVDFALFRKGFRIGATAAVTILLVARATFRRWT